MFKTTVVIGLAILLSGCENFLLGSENTCGGRGHKNVKIEYGDGKFLVDPIIKVKKKRELRFKLKADRQSKLGFDYWETVVETEGKSLDPDDDWLNKSGDRNSGPYFKVCVTDDLVEKGYDYTVTFTNPDTGKQIGFVDPRVIVEPN
jgi:hypothetical protein